MAGEPFDEIMIVNPCGCKGGKRMKLYPVDGPVNGYFAEAPEQVGYYAEAPDVGYVYEAPETMGYYAEAPDTVGYYAEAPEVGYFADPPPGFVEGFGESDIAYFAESPEFAEAPEIGYVYESPEVGYVYESPDTVGYYAEAPEFAEVPTEMGYMYEAPEQFNEAPETMGDYGEPEVGYYGEAQDVNGYGADPGEVGYFAEDPISGYVRESDSRYSPRVVPVDKIGDVEGFYTPKSVNPTCENFRPAERTPERSTEWFKPNW